MVLITMIPSSNFFNFEQRHDVRMYEHMKPANVNVKGDAFIDTERVWTVLDRQLNEHRSQFFTVMYTVVA